MPTKTYTKPTTKPAAKHPPKGKSQYQNSLRGNYHTNFAVEYGKTEQSIDLFRQNFRVVARASGQTIDVSPIVQQLSWQDDSSDQLMAMNTQLPLTGSLQLTKPALNQYDKLLPPVLEAWLTQGQQGVARWGMLGVIFVCHVGYQGTWTPIWAMRAQPNSSGGTTGGSSEEVDLSSGAWTVSLADDLTMLNQSLDDFKFTKGKKVRKKGYRADEITAAVCKAYRVPIARLARGTAYFELPANTTQGVSPLMVISDAYQEETNRTGKYFVIRWATPDKKHPLGALEVVPMRRNPNLLQFRAQLSEAVLTRSQSPDFATAITGRATLKVAHGKDKKLTFNYHSSTAISRFGWIYKKVDFSPVSSMLELQILTKRALARKLTPIRTAELTHPGVATIRRGDAIRLLIPEEGYAPLPLTTYGTPRLPRSKSTSKALQAAEKDDPTLFAMPDPTAISATSSQSTNVDTSTGLTQDQPQAVSVQDQSIAFVTSVTHSASVGTYTMDMQLGFVDLLDPPTVQAQIDAATRAAKAAAKAKSKSKKAAT